MTRGGKGAPRAWTGARVAIVACGCVCAGGALLAGACGGGTSGGGNGSNPADASTDHAATGNDGGSPGADASKDGAGDASSAGDGSSGGGNDAGGDAPIAPSGPSLGGCPLFAPQYAYNLDVSDAGLDKSSGTYISGLKASAPVIGLDYPGGEIYNLVPASQPLVPVQTTSFYGFDSTDTFFFEQDAGGAMAPIPSGVEFENQGTPNRTTT
ncbi:MAG TPA: hypothetical protein VGG39_34335 [Polyangiaceae bacterium]